MYTQATKLSNYAKRRSAIRFIHSRDKINMRRITHSDSGLCWCDVFHERECMCMSMHVCACVHLCVCAWMLNVGTDACIYVCRLMYACLIA